MFAQSKLTKAEWEGIEEPISEHDKGVLKFISAAQHADLVEGMPTMNSYLKLAPSDEMDLYVWYMYFEKVPFAVPAKTSVKLKKADAIRLQSSKLNTTEVYELIVVDLCKRFSKNKLVNYYALRHMDQLSVSHPNMYVKQLLEHTLASYTPIPAELLERAVEVLEENHVLTKYQDRALYDHQKQLFAVFKRETPSLIFLRAPTGTGKTLTPVVTTRPLIFICASRHVALSFAKACISMGRKIAFAFGCEEQADVRLHYFAAADCVRNKRTGRIQKVNNDVGDKVEIMICDVISYQHAMEYMLRFNEAKDMVLYWDEPTVGMDQEAHPLHPIISEAWKNNRIPTIVLSSATLPNTTELGDMVARYQSKFGGEVLTIDSLDCRVVYGKTIKVVDPENKVVLPHYYCPTFADLERCVQHLRTHYALLRYMDLGEVAKFLTRRKVTLSSDTIMGIKLAYIEQLAAMTAEEWPAVYAEELKCRHTAYASTIRVMSEDAHTLTNGPTIYMTSDPAKIAAYCLQTANVPSSAMEALQGNLTYNMGISKKIADLEKDEEDSLRVDVEKEKKMAEMRVSAGAKKIQEELLRLRASIRPVTLSNGYVVNTPAHQARFKVAAPNAFVCRIDTTMAETVMAMDVPSMYKVLLLMGVGVLSDINSKYLEMVKDLAAKQALFLIIADTDYIYGTNHQFHHAYIGKDLKLTQEKLIQSFGRVGRGQVQETYSIRLRVDNIAELFFPQVKLESVIMNKLL
jgi:hypothetical protein